ncbi:lipase family protein [Pontibacter mangrovi]|uniref:Alpha/beta hydrolase n=1 Tax=Pontibacter mangrovi TaxID=2589816 RepID=A0A501W2L4_9BACT|nr:hypothetical protein [Pontibacter mangrovi]TPE42520.1 hypothetical protein FJM65_18130 [Pontibacter mangrovi]
MATMTQSSIKDARSPVLKDMEGRETLLVTFGGINQGLGLPVFEFFNSLSSLSCDKLFIRDFQQAWYHRGLDQETSDLSQLLGLLGETIKAHHYQKVCFIGNSMGGYAAILLGTLLNVDKVISFAPQTFIGRWQRLQHLDFRWRKQIAGIYQSPQCQPQFFDLKKALSKRSYTTDVMVFYSPKHRLDRCHAERLQGLANVSLIPIESGGHNIVKQVRASGELHRLLQACLMDTHR